MVVRQSRSNDPQSPLYDHDLPEHVILVSDWLGELALGKFLAHAHDGKDDIPSSIIVNGKGRVPKSQDELKPQEMMPLAVFKVEQVRGRGTTRGTNKFLKYDKNTFRFYVRVCAIALESLAMEYWTAQSQCQLTTTRCL